MVDKNSKKKEKPKVDFLYNIKTYLGFTKKYKWFYVAIFFAIIIAETAKLGDRYLFKIIIDKGTEYTAGTITHQALIGTLLIIAGVYGSFLIVKAICSFISIHLNNRLDAYIIFDIKTKFFNHILQLSHNFHTTHKTGSLITRLNRGSRSVERLTDFLVSDFTPVLVQLVAVSATFFYLNTMAAVTVLVTAAVFISYSVFMSFIQQAPTLRANDADDTEKGNISDYFMNIDSIKYFGKESFISKKYYSLASETKRLFVKLWDYGTWFSVGQSFILGVGTFFLIYFPLLDFLNGQSTLGSLAFIYTSYLVLMTPLYGFVYSIRGVYEAMADFQSLFAYDKIKNDIEDKKDAKTIKVKEGKIEFRDVTFKYHSRNVVDSVSISVKPGEKVALVGHSGSGKTTLVKLLYRFYDPIAGSILIDNVDIKDIKQESLRSELSIVPQECILFDDTIYNNILFSNPSASRSEVLKAIKFAQLDEMVNNLPLKENTIVGERGVKLSGGEKQRVSIARALLANKKILVLDEATSALDSKTEHEIQKDLQVLMKGRTSIIIAHRLSTILSADKIVVLSKGKIVQVGKHNELIRQKGVYKELWNLQKGGYIKE